jgi:hypothetical protein
VFSSFLLFFLVIVAPVQVQPDFSISTWLVWNFLCARSGFLSFQCKGRKAAFVLFVFRAQVRQAFEMLLGLVI